MSADERAIWCAVYAAHFEERNHRGRASYVAAARDAADQATRAVLELRKLGGVPSDAH